MRLCMAVDAATWPLAADKIIEKVEACCPGCAFEISTVIVTPVQPPGVAPRLHGPPWRFSVECGLTVPV